MSELKLSSQVKLAGHFCLQRRKADGTLVQEVEFDNLITDSGLNRLGTAGAFNGIVVGTGTAVPSTTDTQLQAYLNYSQTLYATSKTLGGSPDYWFQRSTTYRFAAGTATGNITEVGAAWITQTAPTVIYGLFSRALILDGGGSPTVITVLPDEILDVTYTVRAYPNLADAVTTFNIGATTHTLTTRVGKINTANDVDVNLASRVQIGHSGYTSTLMKLNGRANAGVPMTLGPVTGYLRGGTDSPWGATASADTAYVNNSLTHTTTATYDLPTANFTGGIESVDLTLGADSSVGFGSGIAFIVQGIISPRILKTNTMELKLTASVTWGRYP